MVKRDKTYLKKELRYKLAAEFELSVLDFLTLFLQFFYTLCYLISLGLAESSVSSRIQLVLESIK